MKSHDTDMKALEIRLQSEKQTYGVRAKEMVRVGEIMATQDRQIKECVDTQGKREKFIKEINADLKNLNEVSTKAKGLAERVRLNTNKHYEVNKSIHKLEKVMAENDSQQQTGRTQLNQRTLDNLKLELKEIETDIQKDTKLYQQQLTSADNIVGKYQAYDIKDGNGLKELLSSTRVEINEIGSLAKSLIKDRMDNEGKVKLLGDQQEKSLKTISETEHKLSELATNPHMDRSSSMSPKP